MRAKVRAIDLPCKPCSGATLRGRSERAASLSRGLTDGAAGSAREESRERLLPVLAGDCPAAETAL